MKTQRQLILEYLVSRPWSAIHEMDIKGVSQNSIGSRLPEMALARQVEGRTRKGENFKEWRVKEPGAAPDRPGRCAREERHDRELGASMYLCSLGEVPCKFPLGQKFCKNYKE